MREMIYRPVRVLREKGGVRRCSPWEDLRDDVPRSETVWPNFATSTFAVMPRFTSTRLTSYCGLLRSKVAFFPIVHGRTFLVDGDHTREERAKQQQTKRVTASKKASSFSVWVRDTKETKRRAMVWRVTSDVAILSLPKKWRLALRKTTSLTWLMRKTMKWYVNSAWAYIFSTMQLLLLVVDNQGRGFIQIFMWMFKFSCESPPPTKHFCWALWLVGKYILENLPLDIWGKAPYFNCSL